MKALKRKQKRKTSSAEVIDLSGEDEDSTPTKKAKQDVDDCNTLHFLHLIFVRIQSGLYK